MSNEKTYLPIIGGVGTQSAFTPITAEPEQTGGLVSAGGQYATLAALQAAKAAGTLKIGTHQIGGTLYAYDGANYSSVGQNNATVNFNPIKYQSLQSAILKTLHGTSNTRIMFIGDSTTIGNNETANQEIFQGYPYQASQQIGKALCQTGHQAHYGPNPNTYGTDLSTVDNRLLNLSAAWSIYNTGPAFGYGLLRNATTLDPITFTPNVNTDTIDVYYMDGGGPDAFTIKVGATTIGTAANAGDYAVKKVTGTTTLGANTYTIQKAVAGNNIFILGFEAYNSAQKEITCINIGTTASKLDYWLSQPNPVATSQSWTGLFALTQTVLKPDLVCINFGINHWTNSVTYTPQSFKDQLTFIVSTLVAANVPVLLFTPPPSPSATVSLAIQKQYVDAILSIAYTYNISVIDVFNKWGTHEYGDAANWYVSSGNVHPSRAGYGVIGSYFSKFLAQL